jgi:hypothetical protein
MSVERRRALAAAALGREIPPTGAIPGDVPLIETVTGEIRDISPHLIVVENADGDEERLVIAPWATAWHGRPVAPGSLPTGTRVVIRALRSGKVVDRIWADISRMTGTILDINGTKDLTVDLDGGPHRGRGTVAIPYRASGRIRVRHPRFEPGYLFDAIGTRAGGVSTALLPATSQPVYRADAVPPPPPAYSVQSKITGTAVWSDVFDEDEAGVAYPMLEHSDAGCDRAGVSCAALPYLSLGSALHVHNVCANRAAILPIIACGCLTGHFCDRCVECDTSPRGRTVELSPISYVELGGELTKGCFNVRIGLG